MKLFLLSLVVMDSWSEKLKAERGKQIDRLINFKIC